MRRIRSAADRWRPLAILISAPAGSPPVVNDGHGDFVYVPAGSFRMGDNFGDGESRERPVHAVDLDAFYIAKYEMTNGEWRKFRDDPGYDDPKFWPERQGGAEGLRSHIGRRPTTTAAERRTATTIRSSA